LLALVCLSIWTVHNKITFDEYVVKSPDVITFTMSSFITYWVTLYDDADAATLYKREQVDDEGL
jgi:hypothetical protein